MSSASVLSAPHRLTRGDDLRRVSRRGRRSGGDTLVLHLLRPPGGGVQRPTQVGFVVSRGVGNSVVRHRVQRRLRHLLRERLDEMPTGSQVVVRALAPAAGASYAELGADVDRCLLRVLGDRPGSRQGERPVHGQGSVS